MKKIRLPGWLRPPKAADGAQMSLADHLRELRYRLIVCLLAIAVAMVGCCFFESYLERILTWPYSLGVEILKQSNPNAHAQATNSGMGGPFMLWLKLVGFGAIILTCPVWMYQLWAFIAPGLLAQEKKWAYRFMGAALPLFLFGSAIGYFVIPAGIAAMLAFTPTSVETMNLIDLGAFLDLMMKMVLIFGLAFLLPVLLVVLNFAGVITGKQMGKYRSYAIFISFVIGAAATPGTDPFSMCALAIPLSLLYLIAEFIARGRDKRVATREFA